MAWSCSGKAVVDGVAPAPHDEEACPGPLCFEADASDRLAETAALLAECVAEPDAPQGKSDGLRVGVVEVLEATDLDLTLRLTLVNTSPDFVSSYPGLGLSIFRDDALIGTSQSGTYYGIGGCEALSSEVRLAWELVQGARLVVSATNDLGAETVDSIAFTLIR